MELNKKDCNYIDLARFIGIYLVVFAHITLLHSYSYLSYMIYSFHMPLFFMISGILHKNQNSHKESLRKNFWGLIVPFIIYNLLGYIYLAITSRSFAPPQIGSLYNYLTIQSLVSGATWFFIVLFGLKTIAIFLKSKKSYILTSLACFALLTALKSFFPETKNIFMYQSTLMAFPSFAFGYLIKNYLDLNINKLLKIFWIVLSIPILYFTTTQLRSISIAEVTYYNLILNFVVSTIGSISILFFSQLMIKFIRCQFIKDMSRGTMIIVGLHFFIMHQVFSFLFGGPKPITHALFLSTVLFLSFYPIIKLTYDSLPILYGKIR